MKPRILARIIAFKPAWRAFLSLLAAGTASAGTVIDQSNMTNFDGGFYSIQYANPPIGQSFTPGLDALNFVELFTDDFQCLSGLPGCKVSATILQVTLFSGSSFAGPPLGASEPLTLPGGFDGPSTFHFSSPVALTPGGLYRFEVSVLSGDNWGVGTSSDTYLGGTMILGGAPFPQDDLWFAEGTASTPELSTMALLLSGLACLSGIRLRRYQTQPRSLLAEKHPGLA